jgi:hypothetical protein
MLSCSTTSTISRRAQRLFPLPSIRWSGEGETFAALKIYSAQLNREKSIFFRAGFLV